jgi:hypothetical protein
MAAEGGGNLFFARSHVAIVALVDNTRQRRGKFTFCRSSLPGEGKIYFL